MKNKLNSAFSLLEVAIVVAIIGLLVTGVFGVTAMKERAEIMALSTMVQDLNSAYQEFVKIYGQKPGDFWNASNHISPECFNGNGNGVIDFDSGTNIDEKFLSLMHLSFAGLIDKDSYSGSHVISEGKQNYSVKNGKFSNSGFHLDSDQDGLSMIIFSSLEDLDGDGMITGLEARIAAISPFDAKYLDAEFDDGLPESGSIRAVQGSNSTEECSNAGEYLLHKNTACVMFFYLDYGQL